VQDGPGFVESDVDAGREGAVVRDRAGLARGEVTDHDAGAGFGWGDVRFDRRVTEHPYRQDVLPEAGSDLHVGIERQGARSGPLTSTRPAGERESARAGGGEGHLVAGAVRQGAIRVALTGGAAPLDRDHTAAVERQRSEEHTSELQSREN